MASRKKHVSTYTKSRIALYDQFPRWRSLMDELGVTMDNEMAKLLLDSFMEKRQSAITEKNEAPPFHDLSSTPVKGVYPRMVADISSVDSDSSERTLTGIGSIPNKTKSKYVAQSKSSKVPVRKRKRGQEKLSKPSDSSVNTMEKSTAVHSPARKSQRIRVPGKLSDSFINPFELSISFSEEDDEGQAEGYESDYESESNITFTAVLPDVNMDLAEVTFEELEYGEGLEDKVEEEEEEEEDTMMGEGIKKIRTEEECHNLTEETTCLCFFSQIMTLAETRISRQCSECGCTVHLNHRFVGSALYLTWMCEKGHALYKWCSQPVLNRRVLSGDFLISHAVVASGNNFGKVALLAKILNLKFVSKSTFYRIQVSYMVPAVDEFWTDHEADTLSSFKDKELIILADGRMDSPGHTAQYCTYTMMEEGTKKVLTLRTLDKRETNRNSVNLEKKGFVSCMRTLQEQGLVVKEVVTDAHLAIGALMRSDYDQIKHSNDVWHAAKNLGKKDCTELTPNVTAESKAGQKKGCGILLKWSRDIVNHLWYCCQKANTYTEFVSMWRGVLHHFTNQHSWVLSHGHGMNECSHGPLTDDDRNKPWLDACSDSEALSALAGIVLDKRFLNRVHYLLNFRSTAEVEVFNQLILKYCAKRFAYTPPVYKMRNQLAALDHNMNVERPVLRNRAGNIVYNRCYNKKSGRWTVFPMKIEKSYAHTRDITDKALMMRLKDKTGMRRRPLELDDPRRISKHLAPESPPPTAELVRMKKSRFQQKD